GVRSPYGFTLLGRRCNRLPAGVPISLPCHLRLGFDDGAEGGNDLLLGDGVAGGGGQAGDGGAGADLAAAFGEHAFGAGAGEHLAEDAFQPLHRLLAGGERVERGAGGGLLLARRLHRLPEGAQVAHLFQLRLDMLTARVEAQEGQRGGIPVRGGDLDVPADALDELPARAAGGRPPRRTSTSASA